MNFGKWLWAFRLSAPVVFILGIVLWVFCIIIAIEMGKQKHFNQSWWYGLLFGPIGVLLLYVRPAKKASAKK